MQSGGNDVRNTEWFHMLNADVISIRTSGSIRGMRPGIWLSTRFPWRWSTSILPRINCC